MMNFQVVDRQISAYKLEKINYTIGITNSVYKKKREKKRINGRRKGKSGKVTGWRQKETEEVQKHHQSIANKTLGRALDPRANGTWLSKLTEWNKK